MNYTPEWNLSTIPDPELHSEVGRRRRAKAPHATNVNLRPCAQCSQPLTATQRRQRCPHCGYTHPRRAAQ